SPTGSSPRSASSVSSCGGVTPSRMRWTGLSPTLVTRDSTRSRAAASSAVPVGGSSARMLCARRVMPRERSTAKPSASRRCKGCQPVIRASARRAPPRGRGDGGEDGRRERRFTRPSLPMRRRAEPIGFARLFPFTDTKGSRHARRPAHRSPGARSAGRGPSGGRSCAPRGAGARGADAPGAGHQGGSAARRRIDLGAAAAPRGRGRRGGGTLRLLTGARPGPASRVSARHADWGHGSSLTRPGGRGARGAACPDRSSRRHLPRRPVRGDLGAGREAAAGAGRPAHRLGEVGGVLPLRAAAAAARGAGVRAEAISSANPTEWRDIEEELAADEIDVLLVSPERLVNPRFREEQLPRLVDRCGLLVIDEAHCISDWGHDFRPDYRRLRDLVAELGAEVPVLATTATANSRVVADVAEQLGTGGADGEVLTLRGALTRESLRLGSMSLADDRQRLDYLVRHLDAFEGSG